jgi:hypothetical protein
MTWLAAHVFQAGDAASLRDHFSLGRCFKWANNEGWQLLRVREEEAARQIAFALAAPNVPTSLKFRLEALSASFEKSHVRRFATAISYRLSFNISRSHCLFGGAALAFVRCKECNCCAVNLTRRIIAKSLKAVQVGKH